MALPFFSRLFLLFSLAAPPVALCQSLDGERIITGQASGHMDGSCGSTVVTVQGDGHFYRVFACGENVGKDDFQLEVTDMTTGQRTLTKTLIPPLAQKEKAAFENGVNAHIGSRRPRSAATELTALSTVQYPSH